MKIIVNPHKLEIEKSPVNEKEINITKCEFEFSEEITNDYVKEAYFTLKDNTYKQIIVNNQCDIPSEVLEEKGQVTIGVVAFLAENETEIKRYNPSPAYFESWLGSLKDAENVEPITPSDKEQMEQAIQDMETKIDNLDIDAEKVDKTTTVTITKKDGSPKEVEILDGEDGASFEYNWVGTSLGVKTSEEQDYNYVDLKGSKGDPGAIKILIVNELPATGEDDTIYLVPYQEAETGNIYKEYIYINGNWEELGSIPVEVDLSDYYTKEETNALIPIALSQLSDDTTHRLVTDTEKSTWNGKVSPTDYASSSKGGVIKINPLAGFTKANGELQVIRDNYTEYQSRDNKYAICKGTLEAVITGKDLTTKSYVDGLVGDIGTILDNINGESL